MHYFSIDLHRVSFKFILKVSMTKNDVIDYDYRSNHILTMTIDWHNLIPSQKVRYTALIKGLVSRASHKGVAQKLDDTTFFMVSTNDIDCFGTTFCENLSSRVKAGLFSTEYVATVV